MGLLELKKIENFWPNFLQEKIREGEWFTLSKSSFNFFGRSAALVLVFFFATKIASRFGTHLLAAHYIMIQLWLFSSFFIDGLAVTATLLTAQYLGKKQLSSLRGITYNISLLAFSVGGGFLILFAGFGHYLWPLFSHDPKLWSIIEQFWPFIWVSQPLNALAFIADGILFGMEEFRFLRRHIWIGCLLGYLPLVVLTIWQHQYSYLLWGLILLNLYRVISGYSRISSLLRRPA